MRFEIQRMKEQQDKLSELSEEHVARLNDELRLEKVANITSSHALN